MAAAIEFAVSPTELLQQTRKFALDYYRRGNAEKTIVVGLSKDRYRVAFAVGLRNDSQQRQLAIMARYLFAKHHVDTYVLMMPAWLEDSDGKQEVVAVELRMREQAYLSICPLRRSANDALLDIESGEIKSALHPLVEDLLARGQSLPGIMRRELDRAYNALRLEFPEPELNA